MNAHNEALARDFLKMTDTQGDIFVDRRHCIHVPKMGTARGKDELGKFYQDLAPMYKRYPMIQTLLIACPITVACLFRAVASVN